MTNEKKQEIAKIIIKVLKSRFDSFPDDITQSRNAPFHKAFLNAFFEKFDKAGTNINAMISMSSWMHGLNTTLGQTFFEKVAHILSDGSKRKFGDSDLKIYSNQKRVINEIMTDLKNGNEKPNMKREDDLLRENATGNLVIGTNFTADCYIESSEDIIAIELKSVRPNSGETRGEKQKILEAKAALRIKYPNKKIKYVFGFPFDPTAENDTDYDKKKFMSNMIEFPKFCDTDEILLADELWSSLSGEENTMQEILDLIRTIATPDFDKKFEFINNIDNLLNQTDAYINAVNEWYLFDESNVADNITKITASKNKRIEKVLYSRPFQDDGTYNDKRIEKLLNF